jgi:hypothetical protein
VASRIAQVQFHLNWQWPGITMQYQRLMDRSQQPMEIGLAEHMQLVADMDFLVTEVRRLLRTAELARQVPSEHQEQLRLALNSFKSKWRESLKAIRDALEHLDTSGDFPVPSVGFPMSGDGDGNFTFVGRHGNLDLVKMYEDARSVARAIARVIGPSDAELNKAALASSGGG